MGLEYQSEAQGEAKVEYVHRFGQYNAGLFYDITVYADRVVFLNHEFFVRREVRLDEELSYLEIPAAMRTAMHERKASSMTLRQADFVKSRHAKISLISCTVRDMVRDELKPGWDAFLTLEGSSLLVEPAQCVPSDWLDVQDKLAAYYTTCYTYHGATKR